MTKKDGKKVAAESFDAKQAFISGIPYECSEQEFGDFFGSMSSHITEIKMPRYQDSGKCIGYAHVAFDHIENQIKAIALSG